MVEELSEEEQDLAACTSYAYWFCKQYYCEGLASPPEELRLRMAMREARRHLVGESHDETNALDRLRSCLQYRKVRSGSA